MHFLKTSTLLKTDLKLSTGKTPIKEVTEAGFLGVTFDTQLNWIAHITQLQRKLKVSFATIKRNSEYIPSSNIKIFITRYVNPAYHAAFPYGGRTKNN